MQSAVVVCHPAGGRCLSSIVVMVVGMVMEIAVERRGTERESLGSCPLLFVAIACHPDGSRCLSSIVVMVIAVVVTNADKQRRGVPGSCPAEPLGSCPSVFAATGPRGSCPMHSAVVVCHPAGGRRPSSIVVMAVVMKQDQPQGAVPRNGGSCPAPSGGEVCRPAGGRCPLLPTTFLRV